jgi:AraC-like DNA-binding protein
MEKSPVLVKAHLERLLAPERFEAENYLALGRMLARLLAGGRRSAPCRRSSEGRPPSESQRLTPLEELPPGDLLDAFTTLGEMRQYLWRLYDFADPQAGGAENLARHMTAYIHSHYGQDLSLAAFSEKYRLNANYLSEVFKHVTGCNFVEYLNEVRLKKATGLLETPGLSIKDIALGVGYASPEYFHRVFKERYGVTPQQYRAIVQSDGPGFDPAR